MYTVTVTDEAGCTETGMVTIEEFTGFCDNFDATIGATHVDCNGNNNGTAFVTPSGGTQPYTYNWNNGSNSASLNEPSSMASIIALDALISMRLPTP